MAIFRGCSCKGNPAARRAEPERAGFVQGLLTEALRDLLQFDAAAEGRMQATGGRPCRRASMPGWAGQGSPGSCPGAQTVPRAFSSSVSISICLRFCCSSGPWIRKVSSTRSPRVLTLAICKLILCSASTRATR